MHEYQLLISKTAQKQLDKLPDSIAEVLIEAIQALPSNPRPHGYKKLKGGKLTGYVKAILELFTKSVTEY